MKLCREPLCEKIREMTYIIITMSISVFIGTILASLVVGCATISRILPETTKEATSVTPEIQEAADAKGVKVIETGKKETIKRLNKL